MKTKISASILILAAVVNSLCLAQPAISQVTGAIVAMTDSSLTVLNGQERVQIARDANAKSPAGLKVGDKVTITYTITPSNSKVATGIALKADKEARAEDPSATVFPPKK